MPAVRLAGNLSFGGISMPVVGARRGGPIGGLRRLTLTEDIADRAREISAGERLVGGETTTERLARHGYVTPDMSRSRLAMVGQANPEALEAEILRRGGVSSTDSLAGVSPRLGIFSRLSGYRRAPTPVSNIPNNPVQSNTGVMGQAPITPVSNVAENPTPSTMPWRSLAAAGVGGAVLGGSVVGVLNTNRHGTENSDLYSPYYGQ